MNFNQTNVIRMEWLDRTFPNTGTFILDMASLTCIASWHKNALCKTGEKSSHDLGIRHQGHSLEGRMALIYIIKCQKFIQIYS